MAKAKPKSTFMIADGAGGMARVEDRRFEPPGIWPIRFEVPKEQADPWLRYFQAECGRRRWSSGGMVQMEAVENSGSITVRTGDAGQPQLAVVWERKRGGPLKVRARSAGAAEFPLAQAQELFEQVNEKCRAGATERFYRRGHLHYRRLAWRGELWLDDTVRLGPPALQDETAESGPRVILVDALVDCVGESDANYVFTQQLRELSTFLTVATGIAVSVPVPERTWTYTAGAADCAVRHLGYFEPNNPTEMPARGGCRAMPLRPVSRPDFSHHGLDGTTNEECVPADITGLWAMYRALTPDRRRQFLQAAGKWQEALAHWGDRSTLSFTLMVVACEALKPPEPQFKDHNIYQVIEALLGKAIADRLREQWFRPQEVRSAHLHNGECRSSEFELHRMASYWDPTFDQAHRELWNIAQAAIIEWLQRGGTFTMPPLTPRRSWRRWVKDHAFPLLAVLASVGLIAGIALGWLLRMLYQG
jgi:hypothetical protein